MSKKRPTVKGTVGTVAALRGAKATRKQGAKATERPGDDAERVKVSLYLDPSDLEALEDEQRRRRRSGASRGATALSALVREAIRATYGSGAA